MKRILRKKEAQHRDGLTNSLRYRLIAEGKYPKPVHLYPGSRAVGWLEEEVDAWIKARVAEREAEAA